MEGIKNSVLSNSILCPINSKLKNQSNINLDYMNEIAKFSYNDDKSFNNVYITMEKKTKLEKIYNDILEKIIILQTNITEKKSWMNNDIILELFFNIGKLDNILENTENHNYISIIKKNLLNNNFNIAKQNLIYLKKNI